MNKKKQFKSRLSIKIVLIHFAVVFLFSSITFAIVRGFNMLENMNPRDNNTILILILVFPIIYGALITLIVSYILNITIVSRIRKLKDATAKVAKGEFDDPITVSGTDELSQLTESFNKMTLELKANEYLSKDFIRNISHEYKTPLSIVKAYGELISDEVKKEALDKQLIEQYVQIVIDEADRMSTLSKNILQLSLLDSTTIIKKEETFSPAEQIRTILRASHVAWAQKNIEFKLQLDETTITNNEQLLYQTWQNLIQNAIKFSNENGEIHLTLTIKNNELEFIITDFGLGIAKDAETDIFKHFYIEDKTRNSEGSGLGLAIVKSIIDKLEGTIIYLNNENSGTTFKVNFPL